MKFEWDEAKRRSNVARHGIDFVSVNELFDGLTITISDDRFAYDEERFVTFGILNGRVLAVVHTESESSIRIVSVRKANKNEQENFFRAIRD